MAVTTYMNSIVVSYFFFFSCYAVPCFIFYFIFLFFFLCVCVFLLKRRFARQFAKLQHSNIVLHARINIYTCTTITFRTSMLELPVTKRGTFIVATSQRFSSAACYDNALRLVTS